MLRVTKSNRIPFVDDDFFSYFFNIYKPHHNRRIKISSYTETMPKMLPLETAGQWPLWAKAMKETLGLSGHGRLLPGASAEKSPEKRDEESSDEYASRVEKWEDKTDRAMALIRSKLSSDADKRVESTPPCQFACCRI